MRDYIFPQLERIRENVSRNEVLKKNVEKMNEYAKKTIGSDIPVLSFSDFSVFFETGSRKEYEYPYFERRKRLNYFAILSVLYDNETYLKELKNIVWAVLDEFTWALPAHIFDKYDTESYKTVIDLFAAETAAALCEIAILFEKQFDSVIIKRIKGELRNRIIEPFFEKEYYWEKLTNNWSAVCGGCVGSVFLYMAEDNEIKDIFPRIEKVLNAYLSGFGNDGACTEGLDYWVFGFGHYCYYAELVLHYSKGKINLFDNKKVHSIALFPQKIHFKGNKNLNFSDADDVFSHRMGLSSLLAEKYKDFIPSGNDSATLCDEDICQSFSHLIRDFAFATKERRNDKEEYGTFYFEDAGWYIKKTPIYEFAVKAGNNGESHNHIDIGSFIINSRGKSIIIDSGKGEYTAEYFSKNRYKCFPTSAIAHNIPIFDGKTQGIGAEYKGKIISVKDCEIVLDLKEAYDFPLSRFNRKFGFSDNAIVMCDSVAFSDKTGHITEHFVTEYKPYLKETEMVIENTRLKIPGGSKCNITEKTFSSSYDKSKTIYMIDIEICEDITEVQFQFLI